MQPSPTSRRKMSRLRQLAEAQLSANGTHDDKVERIVNALSGAELRELAYPVVSDYLHRVIRNAEAVEEYTRVEEVREIVDGKLVVTQVPVVPTLQAPLRAIPRDAGGQLERQSAREVEQRALRDLQKASTQAQRVAAFVFLKSYTISVEGREVPWHEATKAQRDARIKMLGKQILGLNESQTLLYEANKICGELRVDTLSEAENVLKADAVL